MSDPVRWPREAWLPILTGLFWLEAVSDPAGLLLCLVPGALLLSAGVAMLLIPGDGRIAQLGALGGVLGFLASIPGLVLLGPGSALFLMAAAVLGTAGAGWHSVRLEPNLDEVPEPRPSNRLALEVAVDEALVSTFLLTAKLPGRAELARIEGELAAARERFDASGWLEKPADYHAPPPPLESPSLRPRRFGRIHYEHLSFESGYEPHEGEPGRERWLSYVPNHTAHAWIVRHAEPRPWLVCVHGYQMGLPAVDLGAFYPPILHRELGLNLAMPTLPFHGPRRVGRRSGDGFVAGDILDTTHALAQALWDIRRLLSWIRAQGGGRVGVMGYSLGGYTTALLACLDNELACAIPGIPATSFTRAYDRHVRPGEGSAGRGEAAEQVLRVVSPLALEPLVGRERRYLFAGIGDRIVPPDQPRDLWRHWDRPRIEWYQGSHVSFWLHRHVIRFIRRALRESGLTVATGGGV